MTRRRTPQHATIAERIRELNLDGFGGACYSAAKTINKEVFGGKGKLVGAANKFWLKRGRFLGHVAVLSNGTYWDADARPKDYEDIESWGMLDTEDASYDVPGWNEDTAYEAVRLEGHALSEAWADTEHA